MIRKRHSPAETAAKLRQADDLLQQGKTQREVARILGVSAMTFHRWRKGQGSADDAKSAAEVNAAEFGRGRLKELELENARLRKLVTDLLLEKLELEEALGSSVPAKARAPMRAGGGASGGRT